MRCVLLVLLCGDAVAGVPENEDKIGVLQLQVNGRTSKFSSSSITTLPASPATVTFNYGPLMYDGPGAAPMRIRYKLEGQDPDWREAPNRMRLLIGFLDQNGSEVKAVDFFANGQSPGWTGNFETAPLQHRRETVLVPPGATRFWVVITSAGGPETLGVYVISDFVVRVQEPANGQPSELLRCSFDARDESGPSVQTPTGWMRDGIRTRMAKVVKIGTTLKKKALAIVDDDPRGHAQWNTLKTDSPSVTPGERLIVEWNEMFSVGRATPTEVTYQDLAPGYYHFYLNQLTLMGLPTEVESSIEIQVPLPFWRAPWFWVAVITVAMTALFFANRYRSWRRLQAENIRLAHLQALERERFRIAQDIHDDLGARVTQISLASAMAEQTASDSDASKAGFQNITQLARSLVASLYDTIWVVNPENDNLEAVGNYLCQMINQLASQAGLRCRLEVPALPANMPVTSHQRHNLCMAVKESVHNIIKHARATEVGMKIILDGSELNLYIRDDGCGFDPESIRPGKGLNNIRRRLEDVGGSAEVCNPEGKGTIVHLRMPVSEGKQKSPGDSRKPKT